MAAEGDGADGERFPAAARIGSSEQIRTVFREGTRHGAGALEVFVLPSPAARPRAAFVVPRHGRTIAERNRLKRRLREIVRRGWLPRAHREGPALDVVVRARPGAYGASFDRLRRDLVNRLEAVSWDEGSSSA